MCPPEVLDCHEFRKILLSVKKKKFLLFRLFLLSICHLFRHFQINFIRLSADYNDNQDEFFE